LLAVNSGNGVFRRTVRFVDGCETLVAEVALEMEDFVAGQPGQWRVVRTWTFLLSGSSLTNLIEHQGMRFPEKLNIF